MGGDSRRFSLFVAFVVLTVAFLPGSLVLRSEVPPGADPGLMLALSYAFEGVGPEDQLAYAPGLPFLMLVLRQLSADNLPLLLGLIKALGLVLLFVEAFGLAIFAGAIAGRRAAVWTFIIAALNPNGAYQLLWGGYAQFLGVGLGSAGLGLLHWGLYGKGRGNRFCLLAAGSLLGAVVLVHAYSIIFFVVAATYLVSFAWLRGPKRGLFFSGFTTAAAASLVALPSLPVYLHMGRELGGHFWTVGRVWHGYLIAAAEIVQGIFFHPVVNGLMALAFVLVLVMGRRSGSGWPKDLLLPLSSFVVGCVALLVVTPPLHLARVGLFLCHGCVLFMGCTLARMRPDRAPKGIVVSILVLFAVIPLVSYIDLKPLFPHYARLDMEDAEAMRTLGAAATGRVLVASPTPNIEGWWFEGLTGRPALIGDRLRWYMLEAQRERSVAAQTLLHSSRVLDGGSLKLLELSSTERGPVRTLWVDDNMEFYPLLQFRGRMGSSAHFEVVGKTEGINLKWQVSQAHDSPPSRLSVQIEPPPGVIVRQLSHDEGGSLQIDCEFLYEPFRLQGFQRVVWIKVIPSAGWQWALSESDQKIRVDLETNSTPMREGALELQVRVRGIQPSGWRAHSQEELLSKWNVTHVYVRGNRSNDRFRHSLFEPLWKRNDITAYRVRSHLSGALGAAAR